MSMVGATRANGVESRSKAYNIQPEYRRNNRAERKANRQFTDGMRACNGCVWTPALEDAVLSGDSARIEALLVMPNLKKLPSPK